MRYTVRTIYSGKLQTCKMLNIPFSLDASSTLNEKFNIQSGVIPSNGQVPNIGYFAVGRGGHRIETGSDGNAYNAPVSHRVTDAALFNQMPFVMRLESDDLTPEQRVHYALRRKEIHDGKTYFAYYLKRLDKTDLETLMKLTTIREGVETSVPFEPDNSNLNPTHPVINPEDPSSILPDGDEVSVNCSIELLLNETDVAELIEVAKILYGGEQYAVVSEMAICSGVDALVQAEGPGGVQFTFNEAIAVQCSVFFSTYQQLVYTNQGTSLLVDVGVSESLLTETTA